MISFCRIVLLFFSLFLSHVFFPFLISFPSLSLSCWSTESLARFSFFFLFTLYYISFFVEIYNQCLKTKRMKISCDSLVTAVHEGTDSLFSLKLRNANAIIEESSEKNVRLSEIACRLADRSETKCQAIKIDKRPSLKIIPSIVAASTSLPRIGTHRIFTLGGNGRFTRTAKQTIKYLILNMDLKPAYRLSATLRCFPHNSKIIRPSMVPSLPPISLRSGVSNRISPKSSKLRGSSFCIKIVPGHL